VLTWPRWKTAFASALGLPDSPTLGKILELLFRTEVEQRLATLLPGGADDLARRAALPPRDVRDALDALVQRGAIAISDRTPPTYHDQGGLFALRDAAVIDPRAPPELFVLWERLWENELPEYVRQMRLLRLPPQVRVFAAIGALPREPAPAGYRPFEDLRTHLEAARVISAMPCACRCHARGAGRGATCPAPAGLRLCLTTDALADSTGARRHSERIDAAGAIERLLAAEAAGLVHTVSIRARRGVAICNCCRCCCLTLHLARELGAPETLVPSGFRAELRTDLCKACGRCAARCAGRAIEVLAEAAEVEPARCLGCGLCALVCPEGAIRLIPRAAHGRTGPGGQLQP
jgi:Pyruvate/2-oxoacid:ferredoxin oxidoreductase delta subunit